MDQIYLQQNVRNNDSVVKTLHPKSHAYLLLLRPKEVPLGYEFHYYFVVLEYVVMIVKFTHLEHEAFYFTIANLSFFTKLSLLTILKKYQSILFCQLPDTIITPLKPHKSIR